MSKAFKKLQKQREEEELIKNMQNLNKQIPIINNSNKSNKNKAINFNVLSNTNTNNNINNNTTSDSESKEDDVVETTKELKVDPITKKKKRKRNKNKKNIIKNKSSEEFINPYYYADNDNYDNNKKEEKKKVFHIYINTLNYNKELDSYFKGSTLVEGSDLSHLNNRQKAYYKQQLLKNKPKKKFYLVHNEEIIQKIPQNLDLSITKTKNNIKYFAFMPSKSFVKLEDPYSMVKNSGNPNLMFDFYRENPHYPLIQYDMAEYYRLKNMIKEANLMLERLILLYEDSLTYEFKILDNNCNNIMVLDYFYNNYTSLFFKCLLKFIVILMKRSCFKSAFEYTKLLLKLDPYNDPMGALTIIDNLAILAGRFSYIIDFIIDFPNEYTLSKEKNIKYSLLLYPNYIYSIALTKFTEEIKQLSDPNNIDTILKENNDNIFIELSNFDIDYNKNSTFYLILGIILYPKLMLSLIESSEMNKISASKSYFKENQKLSFSDITKLNFFSNNSNDYIYSFLNINDENDTIGVKKVIEIYADRNKILWKTREVALWVKSSLGLLLNKIDNKEFDYDKFIEECICTETENCKKVLNKFRLNFQPSIHKNLYSKEFNDSEAVIDFDNMNQEDIANENNIMNNGNLEANNNNINLDQNIFRLFIDSLMPNTVIPDDNNNGGNLNN